MQESRLYVQVENALWELGGVPKRHRTDQLSTAVRQIECHRIDSGTPSGWPAPYRPVSEGRVMIAPELEAEILRLYYAEKWKVGTIASVLGLHLRS